LGTGNEQKITITASTKLTKEEIDRMIKEAEQYAEQDKKRRELAEIKNQGEALIYSAEKTIKEMGDKIPAEKIREVENCVSKLRETLKSDNITTIKADMESLTKVMHEIASTIYQKVPQPPPEEVKKEEKVEEEKKEEKGKGKVVDAEYEVVEDKEEDKKKKKGKW
jgi:molecular chaperone DnaK